MPWLACQSLVSCWPCNIYPLPFDEDCIRCLFLTMHHASPCQTLCDVMLHLLLHLQLCNSMSELVKFPRTCCSLHQLQSKIVCCTSYACLIVCRNPFLHTVCLFAGEDHPCYAVRLCKSPKRPCMAWNRDVNACINTLHLVLAFACGHVKPAFFCTVAPVQH